MSQKEDENDFSFKNNFYQSLNQQQQPGQFPILPPNQPPQSQLMPPPPPFWDYWSNYYAASMANPTPFDLNSSVFLMPSYYHNHQHHQSNQAKTLQSKSQSQAPGSKLTSTKNQASTAAAPTPAPMTPNVAGFMPSPHMPPFMDPATYMYFQMAAHQPYGYPFQPFGMQHPYGLPFPPGGSISGGARQLQDDQMSMHSFRYDMDNRSEKKFNLNQERQTLNNNLNNSNIKSESKDNINSLHSGGLLLMQNMHNPQMGVGSNDFINMDQRTSSTTENSSLIKREEQHRMTPQIHQLPHVRASFSLNGLVQIRANDPCEGQPALVDIINLTDLMEHYLADIKQSRMSKTINIDDQDQANEEDEESSANEMKSQIVKNYNLMQEFPGPLTREHTSKAQVIQFCQKNVKQCLSNSNINLIDPQSHALLWDFLALLVRQNGLVDLKTDISPLLLTGIGVEPLQQQQQQKATSNSLMPVKQLSNSASSSSLVNLQQQQDFVLVNNDSSSIEQNQVQPQVQLQVQLQSQPVQQTKPLSDEELHLNKLRQLLGAGQRMDAIELAVKFNMWPHAFFLASYSNGAGINCTTMSGSQTLSNINANTQTDSKLLGKVKTRFINSLQQNDPIQTCYQLLVGRIPSVANNLSKLDWNDWRRHLAMIVSNVDDTNRDLVLNSIKTMGDTLASNGRVAASHFCYLLANCPFGTYDKKSSKLVLISSSHNQDFTKFSQIVAIQATEIFEFANSLTPSQNGQLEHFVKYKLIYTARLLEFGLINEASKYIEVIAKSVNSNPKLHTEKISTVFQLANRLKVFDSDFTIDDLTNFTNEPQWLQELNNNYKRLYLNKLWHLWPSGFVEPPLVNQPQNTDALNVHMKKEPKTAEPSPVNQKMNINNSNEFNQEQQQQQQQFYQQDQLQYDVPDISYSMNKLNLPTDNKQADSQIKPQQTLPFYPNYQDSNQIRTYNASQYTSYQANTENQHQTAQVNDLRTEIESENYFHEQKQQKQQDYYNQTDLSSTIPNPSPSYQDSNNGQAFNFSQPSNPNNNNSIRRPSTANSITAPNNTGFISNRSRQSSTSTSYNDSNLGGVQVSGSTNAAAAFNPYQLPVKQSTNQFQQSKSQFFDPNASSHMNRSVSFPTNTNNYENSSLSQGMSQLSKEPIEEHPSERMTSNSNVNDDDDDSELKKDKNSKSTDKNQPQSKGWLSGVFNLIKPANQPKKMVLPDDKKKSIIWDENLKRYVNKDATEDPASTIKPPPIFLPNPAQSIPESSQQISSKINQPQNQQPKATASNLMDSPNNMPTINSASNRFSLKNSANNKRSSYYSKIDVMADQAKKVSTPADSQIITPLLSTMPPPSQMPPRFFVPEPVSSQLSDQQDQQPQQTQQSHNQFYQPNHQQQQPQENSSTDLNQNNLQYQANFVPQHQKQKTNTFHNQEQQNYDYYYQKQQQQQQLPNAQFLVPSNYQHQVDNNYTTEESESATNSADSYNGSSQTSSSNDSNYLQNQQQQQYSYSQNNNYDNGNQYYMPDQHSNI